jgi:hypothetical protein
MAKPKKIQYEPIDPKGNSEPYRLLKEARDNWHDDIHQARIALAWRKELKPDVDGHLVLGKCVKASDLQRELVDWDFVILLNREVWSTTEFDRNKKLALLDHELCHAAPVLDKETLEPKYDVRGRRVWRIRKHDIEEFQSVVQHHGTYKRDLEKFAEAILKAKNTPPLLKDISEVPTSVLKATKNLVKTVGSDGIDSVSFQVGDEPPVVIDKTAAERITKNADAEMRRRAH